MSSTIDLSGIPAVTDDEYYESNPLTEALAPWSITKAKAAKCPQQFIWQYLDRRESDAGADTTDTSLRVGRAMHEIYESLIAGGSKQEAKEVAIVKNGITSIDMPLFEELYSHIPTFMDNFRRLVGHFVLEEGQVYNPTILVVQETVQIEKRFALDAKFNKHPSGFFGKNVFLRGVADVIIMTKDGGCIILDHKSAAYASTKYFEDQLRAYIVAAFALFPELKWAQAGVHFMALGEIAMMPPVMRSQVDGEKRALHYYITTQAVKVPTQETVKGNHCKWCNWRSSCNALRASQRKAMRDASKPPKIAKPRKTKTKT